jgi:hypothetical protein
MCKEMPVIPVNKGVDPIRIIGKMEGRGRGRAQGVSVFFSKHSAGPGTDVMIFYTFSPNNSAKNFHF